ncbi:hypothetical protein [Streptomyces sp. BP-8]|uniref:Uncharacterized protein n=1 Tax=Streptomyces sirii TaxID=3127701 RepID=A0ABZ2QXQ9_9ACTN
MDAATAQARSQHPEWFDWVCHDDPEECPETHCAVSLGRGPYLFAWDEEYDDRYTRFGVPNEPLFASQLSGRLAEAARLVQVDFLFERSIRVDLRYPGGKELLSGTPGTATGDAMARRIQARRI